MARLRATGSPSLPPPSGTLTQELRAIEPPDIARHTIDKQKLLANELLLLPDALEASGLAKSHARSYAETLNYYVNLADATWVAIAEERLEQIGSDEAYVESAVGIGRRVTRMQNESQLAANNTQFPLPRRRPLFWRRRMRLQRAGLRDWLAHLSRPADPRAMGASLARLRGAVSLSRASDPELLLLSLFPTLVGDALALLLLGFVVALIAAVALGNSAAIAGLVAAAAVTLAARIALSLLLRGPARLDRLYALSVFSAMRSPRASVEGSAILAVLLRGWGIVFSLVGLLGMLAAFGYSVWQLVQQQITLPAKPLDLVALIGDLIAQALILPTLAGVVAIGALALPLLLISAFRFGGELGGNVGWVSTARRYALAPAFQVLAWLAAGAIAALAVFATATRLSNVLLTTVAVGPWRQAITLQTVALFVVPALILLAGLDIPFRVGIFRWRRYWLRELTTRRADIDAHVRRLSAVDPQTGLQDSSNENLRAMQYDMVLLQFYATRIEETHRVSSAPYGWLAGIGVALLLVVVALAVDGHAQQLVTLLQSVQIGG
jgi:hypothetical protein